MSDDASHSGDSYSRKRRRRRRRRKGGAPEGAPQVGHHEESHGDGDGGHGGGRRRRGARHQEQRDSGPAVATPTASRSARRRRKRRRRGAPVAGVGRRQRLTRVEIAELEDYLGRLQRPLLTNLYRGLGGQPGRVADHSRMVQLAVRAIAQGKRISGLLRGMHERERTALALLLQCGGIAHSEEFLRELTLSLGGHEREWQRVLLGLAERGLVCASEEQDEVFFYLVPEPLVDHLLESLEPELSVPTFQHEDIRVREARPFSPPMDFSVTTLCTYIDQRPPRLTQQQEIFRVHKEELDRFFAQIWDGDSELFNLHIDFLMGHGLVELRGDRLAVNRDVIEEWLNLDPQDQKDLFFRALDGRFPYAEWILAAVHSGRGEWVAERPLQALYRRWNRGEDWRRRYYKGEVAATKSFERESWSFAPLVNMGMIELGEWGQEKFYRLTPRALALVEPREDQGFTQFYLTPSFEIMAPAGISPQLLFYCGELGELTGCDRANTYRINEISIERALERGWRRETVLDFLRESSQIGLPENVEQTLKGWMGQHGDAELHDVMLLSVHKSRIRKVEGSRALKPFILHRFVPGLYAIDRNRAAEVLALLQEEGFQPAQDIQRYPGDPEQANARDRLLQLLAQARDASDDPLSRAHSVDTRPEDLHPVPGAGGKPTKKQKKPNEPVRMEPREVRPVLEQALSARQSVEVIYLTKDGTPANAIITPQRFALNPEGEQVVVAIDTAKGELRTYKIARIERIRIAKKG